MRVIRLIEEPSTIFSPLVNPLEAEADRVDYIYTIRQIIRKPLDTSKGASLKELVTGIRIVNMLADKKAGDELELSEDDWHYLCEKTLTFGWPAVDERLVRLAQAILNAEERHASPEGLDGDREPVRDERGVRARENRDWVAHLE